MNYLKNDNKNEKVNKLLFLQIIFTVLIVFFTINKMNSIASFFFNIEFFISLALMFSFLLKGEFELREFYNILLLFFIAGFSFIFVLYGYGELTFSYYKKVVLFFSTLLFFFIVTKIKVNKKTINLILLSNIVISMIYAISYFIGNRTYYGEGLTFNYINPNLTGMWLLHNVLYLILALNFYKNKIFRFIIFILSLFIIYFIYETGARNCLISLFLFIIMLLYINFKRKFRINKILITIFVISPLIFAIIYMVMVESGLINVFKFMESQGKGLDSRYGIWNKAFEVIKNRPLIGDYYSISDGTGMSQMHNSHLDIIASYGVIVFLLFVIFLIRIISSVQLECKSKLQIISLICFLVIIFMGMGEAALFNGALGMYILSGGYLLIARYSDI